MVDGRLDHAGMDLANRLQDHRRRADSDRRLGQREPLGEKSRDAAWQCDRRPGSMLQLDRKMSVGVCAVSLTAWRFHAECKAGP